MLLPLISCEAQPSAPISSQAEETTVTEVTEAEAEINRGNYPDTLPETMDFGGKDFVIHHFDDNASEWVAEEENGDIINDTVFRRNKTVSERLNINMKFFEAGTLQQYLNGEITPLLRASIMAGSGDYDLIAGYASHITRGMEMYFHNLNDIEHLNLDQPWWLQDMRNELDINGTLHYAAGDIGLSLLKSYVITFANLGMAKSHGITDIYDTVFSGKWTLDKLNDHIKMVTKDVNNDGIIDGENDITGFEVYDKSSGCDAFVGAFRIALTEHNEDNIEFCIENERTVRAIESLHELFNKNDGAPLPTKTYPDCETLSLNRFAQNNLLYFADRLLAAESAQLRSMESEWGIIPMPKLDEMQEEYGVHLSNAHSLFCIPVDCKDPSMTGAAMEALGAESYRVLTPAYYEVALMTKFARNEETVEILEMLPSLTSPDFATIHCGIGACYFIRRTVGAGNPNFASWWASQESTFEAALDTVIDAYY